MTLTERVEAALKEPIDPDLMNQARELYGTSYTANQPSTTTILYSLLVEQKTLLDTIKANRARIALLESALGLPEGCDPWELERAKVEGARTPDGREWEFICEHEGDLKWVSGEQAFWFDGQGKIIARKDLEKRIRLYCIKKGTP